jgi:hypothetical protein
MTEPIDPNYFAFMLRVWREEAQDRWRASLEDPRSGERQVFADFEQMLDFLRTQAYPDVVAREEDGLETEA